MEIKIYKTKKGQFNIWINGYIAGYIFKEFVDAHLPKELAEMETETAISINTGYLDDLHKAMDYIKKIKKIANEAAEI